MLTPVQSTTFSTSLSNQTTRALNNQPTISLTTTATKNNDNRISNIHSHNSSFLGCAGNSAVPLNSAKNIDFTDAKLIIERNTEGKHIVGKILLAKNNQSAVASAQTSALNSGLSSLNQTLDDLNTTCSSVQVLNKSVCNNFNSLLLNHNSQNNNTKKQIYGSSNNLNCDEMNFLLKHHHQHNNNNNGFQTPIKHNILNNNNNLRYNSNKKNIPASNSLNAINSYLLKFQNNFSSGSSNHSQNNQNNTNHLYATPQKDTTQLFSPLNHNNQIMSASKTESLLKNKMKKLIHKFPTHSSLRKSSSSQQQQQSQNISEQNYNQHQQQQGLLKFNRTQESNSITTTGYSSQNEEYSSSSSELPDNCPIYTVSNLPPRLLKKYQKTSRAITEEIFSDNFNKSLNITSDQEDQITLGKNEKSSDEDVKQQQQQEAVKSFENEIKKQENDDLAHEKVESNSKLFVKPTLSPRAPPRTKKKYRRSKTTDFSRFQLNKHHNLQNDEDVDSLDGFYMSANNNTHQDIENDHFGIVDDDSIIKNIDPKEPKENDDFAAEKKPNQTSKLMNDSLESLNQTIEQKIEKDLKNLMSMPIEDYDDDKVEKDSLADFGEFQKSSGQESKTITTKSQNKYTTKSSPKFSPLSSSSSHNLLNNNFTSSSNSNSENENSNKKERALWDKSKQDIEFKTSNTKTIPQSKTSENLNPPTIVITSSSLSSTSKKTRNLNAAKEKLKAMKMSIDAQVDLSKIKINSNSDLRAGTSNLSVPIANPQSNIPALTTTNNNTRTTPRKVKKRSGERSVTMGLFSESEFGDVSLQATPSAPKTPSTNRQAMNSKNSRPTSPKNSAQKIAQKNILFARQKPVSSSLHNLSMLNEANINQHNARYRRDSNASSVCSTVSHATTCRTAFSTPNVEYKENKAYELRKKSALLNKINHQVKSQQYDPIYSRAHPISNEMAAAAQEQQSFLFANLSPAFDSTLIQQQQNNNNNNMSARKRLFTKKNERQLFDPNLSFQSTSSNSSMAMPSSRSMNLNKTPSKLPQPISNNNSPNFSNSGNHLSRDVIMNSQKTRSRSTIESNNLLMKNIMNQKLVVLDQVPKGDLNKYELMLKECEFLLTTNQEQNNTQILGKTTNFKKIKESNNLSVNNAKEDDINQLINNDVKIVIDNMTSDSISSGTGTSTTNQYSSSSVTPSTNSPNSIASESLSNNSSNSNNSNNNESFILLSAQMAALRQKTRSSPATGDHTSSEKKMSIPIYHK